MKLIPLEILMATDHESYLKIEWEVTNLQKEIRVPKVTMQRSEEIVMTQATFALLEGVARMVPSRNP
jgi:hypothetical protein